MEIESEVIIKQLSLNLSGYCYVTFGQINSISTQPRISNLVLYPKPKKHTQYRLCNWKTRNIGQLLSNKSPCILKIFHFVKCDNLRSKLFLKTWPETRYWSVLCYFLHTLYTHYVGSKFPLHRIFAQDLF